MFTLEQILPTIYTPTSLAFKQGTIALCGTCFSFRKDCHSRMSYCGPHVVSAHKKIICQDNIYQ